MPKYKIPQQARFCQEHFQSSEFYCAECVSKTTSAVHALRAQIANALLKDAAAGFPAKIGQEPINFSGFADIVRISERSGSHRY